MRAKFNFRIVNRMLFVTGVMVSCMLGYFAVNNYVSAFPLAEGYLRGLALAFSSTIESLARKDQSLDALHDLKSPDIAFFSLIDSSGVQVFHSNHELEGLSVDDFDYAPESYADGFSEARLELGTGEEAYEFACSLHGLDKTYILRLVLHTFRADTVLNMARIVMVSIFSLMAVAWLMCLFIYRLSVNADRQREEMTRRENLARIGTMGAVLAHEVRNPLAGIKGYAQLLDERVSAAEEKQFLSLIVAESLRLEKLVNDLLAYSREDESGLKIVDASEIIRLAVRIAEIPQEVSVEEIIHDNILVYADRDKMMQILLNIILNAVQAMPGGGKIVITCTKHGGSVQIDVSDTGQGVKKEDEEKIFDPFFTTKARGSGFGLAISKKYAEGMGGGLIYLSRSSNGSCFRIILKSA